MKHTIKPRLPKSLMPCDACCEAQLRDAAAGTIRPAIYCPHHFSVSIIDGAFLVLHQAYSEDDAAEILATYAAESGSAGVKELGELIVLNALQQSPGSKLS